MRPLATIIGATLLSGAVLAACGSSPKVATTTSTPTTTTTKPTPVALCPLSGTPAPGGVVPQRPAIAMKVDNYSLGPAPAEARPQSGLDYADIVFEEQVEGSITRYAVVFQCRDAPGLVGPIRSARWTDVQMLSQLGHPIFVHVGGIPPVLAVIGASSLANFDLGDEPSFESNPSGRYPPYDDYTTTQALWKWAAANHMTKPPAPIFTYSKQAPNGEAVSQVHLDWSETSDIYWRWNPTTATWLRFYNVGSESDPDIQPDLLANGVQNQAQNVIVQDVSITYGPWVENSEGGLEAESHIIGYSGKAYIFRNGKMIPGTWSVAATGDPTKFVDASGDVIALDPGRTWVEIYPDTAPMVVTPVTPTPTTTNASSS